MSVKKPSAKPVKATKTVSAKAAKPAPKAAANREARAAQGRAVAKPAAAPAAATKPAVARPATNSRPRLPPERIVVRGQPEPVADASRADEPDFEMSPSLLSGPRNVQPYRSGRARST